VVFTLRFPIYKFTYEYPDRVLRGRGHACRREDGAVFAFV
jgi:hypothetical protein